MISILSKAATWSPEQPFGEAFSRVFSSRLCSAQLIWTAVIVEGKVISGRRTLFEDGRGYVVDIQTNLSYGEVVEFYADRYGNGRLTAAPGMGAEFSVADFRLGSKRILLEIHSRETTTYITMAIHLGKWW